MLLGPGRERICATLLPIDSAHLKVRPNNHINSITPTKPITLTTQVAEARFTSPVAGSVFFLSLSLGAAIETKIYTNLYHVVSAKTSQHSWQIYITDILGSNRRRQTCNFLQILYDPDNKVADRRKIGGGG